MQYICSIHAVSVDFPRTGQCSTMCLFQYTLLVLIFPRPGYLFAMYLFNTRYSVEFPRPGYLFAMYLFNTRYSVDFPRLGTLLQCICSIHATSEIFQDLRGYPVAMYLFNTRC